MIKTNFKKKVTSKAKIHNPLCKLTLLLKHLLWLRHSKDENINTVIHSFNSIRRWNKY